MLLKCAGDIRDTVRAPVSLRDCLMDHLQVIRASCAEEEDFVTTAYMFGFAESVSDQRALGTRLHLVHCVLSQGVGMIDEAVELLAANVWSIPSQKTAFFIIHRRLPIPSEAPPCFGIVARALVAILMVLQLELHEGLARFVD